jgi:hypothetical protein
MKRETQLSAELRALRALCDETMSSRLSENLLKSLEGHKFLVPEDQVVFESIRTVLKSGTISASKLAIHLNNRGFPDVDLGRYFAAENTNASSPKRTN